MSLDLSWLGPHCSVQLPGVPRNDVLERLAQADPGSAFFLVDMTTIMEKHGKWQELLPQVKPFYAVKANNSPLVLRLLSALGCGFDCASRQEIELVQRLPSADIVYANPVKQPSHLAFARDSGVDLLTFDSESELEKIRAHHPGARLVLRIKTDDSRSLCRFNCKFGADMDQAIGLLRRSKELGLRVVGVSFHVGSGCSSAEPYRKGIRDARRLFAEAEKLGMPLTVLDLGGGFPGRDTAEIGFPEIAAAIQEELSACFSDVAGLRVIAEPGRYLVADSHTLVVSVIGKKERTADGRRTFAYTVNDGCYGSFNCIFFDHFAPELVPLGQKTGPLYESTVFGPTCDSIDLIRQSCMLPELELGDRLKCEQMGAYTLTAASNFNGLNETKIVYALRT